MGGIHGYHWIDVPASLEVGDLQTTQAWTKKYRTQDWMIRSQMIVVAMALSTLFEFLLFFNVLQ